MVEKNMNRRNLFWLAGILGAMFVLAAPLPAFGQGCALCYTQAAASGARMIEALRNGILILVLPPTLMSVGVAVVAYRRRDRFNQDDVPETDLSMEPNGDH
jgi:hypothetical protein